MGGATNSNLILHRDLVVIGTRFDEWPVEVVTVKCHKNARLCLADVVKELFKQTSFIFFIKYGKLANIIVRFRSVLKVLNISSNDFSVGNQETLPVDNV